MAAHPLAQPGRAIAALFAIWVLLAAQAAFAHPEDEFCTDDSGLDPELCAALAELDRAQQADGTGDFLSEDELQQVRNTVQLDRPWWKTGALYLKLGYLHILPKGLDHILFVLALFLACTSLKPLIIQLSIFTLSHTLTLGMAAAGWLNVSADIVEPLIALSIAYVAIENVIGERLNAWRGLVIFIFGLFHGLGFGGVLIDLGLPQDQFLTALISFNLGVEFGQITVVLAAWLLLSRWFGSPKYRQRVVIPASLLIAGVGVVWAVQRVGLL